MILVDADLLLYAYDASSPRHDAARAWWEAQLSRPDPVGIAWSTLVAFIRIGTHVRVFERPLSIEEASSAVESWLARPMVSILEPGPRHWEILRGLLAGAHASGNLVTDAHLAAVAVEHGARLMSTDKDFVRFPGLSFEDPLAA